MQKIEVDADIALEIASHEAVIRQAYKDSVGKWTWSVGLTNATGHNVERYIDNPQPIEKCLAIYVWALRNYSQQVLEAFDGVMLSKAQFAAACSFHWNTGAIKKASWVKSYKAGRVTKAREQFMAYNKPPEIVERRRKERDLFFDGKWSNDGTMTEFTRLTKKHTPVWSSAKKIHVQSVLRAIFEAQEPIPVDQQPQPEAPIVVPTLSPSPVVDKPAEPVYTEPSLWARTKSWLKFLFG